jgi:hypothetical protein
MEFDLPRGNPTAKLGRNDLCWCRSGKKYKRCHLNRSEEKRLSLYEVQEVTRRTQAKKKCQHPLAGKGFCNAIIAAHTIQRSTSLRKLVDSSNHVMSFSPTSKHHEIDLKRIGWKEASTFPGFCSFHDNQTFRPLEYYKFEGTEEQCFLIGYRAICHEVNQKRNALEVYGFLRANGDRGLNIEEQTQKQSMYLPLEAGTLKGLKEFTAIKSWMDADLLSKDYSKWSRMIISFKGDLCVATAGVVSPNRGLDGRNLQTLHETVAQQQPLLIGIVATDVGGEIVLIWRTGEAAPRAFIDDLLSLPSNNLSNVMVQVIFAYIGNTYFSHKWWTSLSEANRSKLANLARMTNAYYTEFVYSTGRFVHWDDIKVKVTEGICSRTIIGN